MIAARKKGGAMGIQDRDYYWKDRDIGGSRILQDDAVYSPEIETHNPERVLAFLTVLSILALVFFIGYRAHLDRVEANAALKAEQLARQEAVARDAESRALAAAQAVQRERLQAAQLEQKKLLIAKLNTEVDQKLKRDRAWEHFYRPSLQCRADWTVDCANALIKARGAFAAQYKD